MLVVDLAQLREEGRVVVRGVAAGARGRSYSGKPLPAAQALCRRAVGLPAASQAMLPMNGTRMISTTQVTFGRLRTSSLGVWIASIRQ